MNTLTRKGPTVARFLLGFVFALFGLNKLVPFLPEPAMLGAPAQFFGALFATGYMIPLLAITEIVAGLLLLSGRYVPLALALLAPVVVNILGFHTFLVRGGFPVPLIVTALEIYLAWSYRDAFAPMLRARVSPHDSSTTTSTQKLVVAAAR
jgi:uncharacterized membrane protein YphA (DoxX/SURF4 family)